MSIKNYTISSPLCTIMHPLLHAFLRTPKLTGQSHHSLRLSFWKTSNRFLILPSHCHLPKLNKIMKSIVYIWDKLTKQDICSMLIWLGNLSLTKVIWSIPWCICGIMQDESHPASIGSTQLHGRWACHSELFNSINYVIEESSINGHGMLVWHSYACNAVLVMYCHINRILRILRAFSCNFTESIRQKESK